MKLDTAMQKLRYRLPNGKQALDLIRDAGWLDHFCRANVVKYLVRHGNHGDPTDLIKAREYINILIGLGEKKDDGLPKPGEPWFPCNREEQSKD